MYRKQLTQLNNWLSDAQRKPLLLRGARQVGKSTLVQLLAGTTDRPLLSVNLERHPELASSFASNDIAQLLNLFEALPRARPLQADSLLFLDEIQSAPAAIAALRYFHEDRPDLPLLAAGSLLEFLLAEHRAPMPVGRVQYLHMGPMVFSEFLLAVGETRLAETVQKYQPGEEIHPLIHQRLLAQLRHYCFVGGMPEAVQRWADTGQASAVSAVHASILQTYQEDFPKYVGSRSLPRIQQVFNQAARQVGRKVKYSHYSRDTHARTIREDIELLCMARVLLKVTHSSCSGLPLQAELNENHYKLLFMDVGLMNALCGLGWDSLARLQDQQLVNEGAIAEQFVGQHLQDIANDSINPRLVYWLREGRSSNAEVDFVMATGGRILPVEVKAGASGSLKSLHQFMAEKGEGLALRLDGNPPSSQQVETRVTRNGQQQAVRYQLESLPLYLVERLAVLGEG